MCYKVHNKQLGITITKMVILLMLGILLQSSPPISAQYPPLPPVPRIEISPKYVVLHRNGILTPQEERVVVITLTGFQQSNVELQIKRGVTVAEPHIKTVSELAIDRTEAVEIDSITGVGTTTLTIDETWSQDIYWLWATGLTEPTPWYNPDTMPLIVEDQRQVAFPSFQATIHYCPSFFKALHAQNNGAIFAGDVGWADYETMAEKYVDYVEEAVVGNYNAQIVTWGFALPYDENDDGQLHIAIGDGENNVLHAFHAPSDRFLFGDAAWVITEINNSEGGYENELGIHYPADWPREQHDKRALEYPSTQAAIKSTMAHEFFHAVQENYTQGFKSWDWIGKDWWWVTEGQARFLQSAQYETEEFTSRNSDYLKQAYLYLQNDLRVHIIGGEFKGNTSREAGYTYAPFWRTVYEVHGIAAIRNTLEWINARPEVYNCQKCPPQDELTYMSEVIASAIAPPNEIFPLFAARNYALRFTKEGNAGDRDVTIHLHGNDQAYVQPQYVYQYAHLYLPDPNTLPINSITCQAENSQLQLDFHDTAPVIPANYGMEFWELEFANDACRYSAFQLSPGNDGDAFSVQVWPIYR
ncbi:MAG: hypothetical protein JXA21_13855, partial [Anaerolineae bacterium]|nr:hypothetical protein [Anaerolineae bacterium]